MKTLYQITNPYTGISTLEAHDHDEFALVSAFEASDDACLADVIKFGDDGVIRAWSVVDQRWIGLGTRDLVNRVFNRACDLLKNKRRLLISVAPRYTSGSPGLVVLGQACQIASNELKAFTAQLTGVYGDALRSRAQSAGLGKIIYAQWQKRDKVFETDLLTGETHERSDNSR